MTTIDVGMRWLARRRLAKLRAAALDPRPAQERLLRAIVQRMGRTEFGRRHDLRRVRTLADLRRAMPLQNHDSMRDWWSRARHGQPDICWPGVVQHWALSSGTTSGEKYLPVSAATIRSNRGGGFDALVPHLADPRSTLFGGKLLFLGGCTALRREGPVWVGDNTGIMATHVPWPLTRWHAPSAAIRALPSWERKVELAAACTVDLDVRMLAGVPSWIVLFAEAVLAHARRAGRSAATLRSVWPQLQLYVHGGVAFAPYAERVRTLLGGEVRCTDTYSASEGGMLAVQDRDEDAGMLPLLDRGAVFEFVPTERLDDADPPRLGAHEVEPGVDYAVAVTTDAGMASYLLGDVVRFTSVRPLRLCFAGRIAHTLNFVGEHVSGGELDHAVSVAAGATGGVVAEYAVTGRAPDRDDAMAQHHFLIEFHRQPADLDTFARLLDNLLQRGNEDYATHRTYGLRAPRIESLPAGSFVQWMRQRGKVGGQHKVPRVLGSQEAMELRRPFALRWTVTPAVTRAREGLA